MFDFTAPQSIKLFDLRLRKIVSTVVYHFQNRGEIVCALGVLFDNVNQGGPEKSENQELVVSLGKEIGTQVLRMLEINQVSD